MRTLICMAAALMFASCGRAPVPVTHGPRVTASLAATWPVAGPARESAFSRDGRLVAMADASGTITIRDTAAWKPVGQLHHPDGATSVAFNRDGTRLFSSGYDGTVREWDLGRRAPVRTLGKAAGTIWTIDMSPDGTTLASAGEDRIIRLWNLDHAEPPKELRGHDRNVWAVRFSPDGKRLASGSFDATVRLWDVSQAKPVKTLTGHGEAVVGLDFSPDGRLLATASDDSTIRLWRAADGAPLRKIDNGMHVDKVAFAPGGKWIASGGHAHGTLGELWHQLAGRSNGDSVRLWRASDGALVASLPHPDDVIWLAFSPDGRWLLTSGEDDKFRLWRLQPVGG